MFRVKNTDSYKVGLDEVEGLKETLIDLIQPVQKAIKEKIYWSDVSLNEAEYKSRGGFSAYSGNCGGLQIAEIIPECESYDFGFLDFGECDGSEECEEECLCSSEGHLDAALYVWLKFEGLNPDGTASFYLVLHGGNADAPYFRHKYTQTYFEAEFEATSLDDLRRRAQKSIGDLIKFMRMG